MLLVLEREVTGRQHFLELVPETQQLVVGAEVGVWNPQDLAVLIIRLFSSSSMKCR